MVDHDAYLFLQETAHGKRFWRTASDNDSARLLPPDQTLRVFGPATVGANGYQTEEDAAVAIADAFGIDLDDPATW